MIRQGRFAATLQDGFVVFLIGMRVNRPLLIHKWLPVVRAMPRMLVELYRHPELGGCVGTGRRQEVGNGPAEGHRRVPTGRRVTID